MKKILIALVAVLASFGITACNFAGGLFESTTSIQESLDASSIESKPSLEEEVSSSIQESVVESVETSEETSMEESSEEESSNGESESILEGDVEDPETSTSDWIDIEFPRPQ